MLTLLAPRRTTYRTLDDAGRDLWRHEGLRSGLLEVLPLLDDQVVHLHRPLGLLQPVPLQVHASYRREEILAAFGASPLPLQTAVHRDEATRTDLLFITLQKTDRDYSPNTRYLDCAISEHLFHRGRAIALFIRTTKQDPTGRTAPYLSAGTATYVEHRSERPIQITWKLDQPLPGDVYTRYRAAIA